MIRRLAQLPLLRRVKRHPALLRAWHVVHRSRLVVERSRFIALELGGASCTARYTLARAPLSVHLRHGSSDLDILEEVFGMELYAIPEAAAESLSPTPKVLDLGAHVGFFGLWVLAYAPHAQIIAVEPDRDNAAHLRATIAANNATLRWTHVAAAAATHNGLARFASGGHAESRFSAAGAEILTRDALSLMEEAELVKIDIEGGEWPLLADPRLSHTPVRALVLEYHQQGCPTSDSRAHAHHLLRAAGFMVQDIPDSPAGAGMLWAWRS